MQTHTVDEQYEFIWSVTGHEDTINYSSANDLAPYYCHAANTKTNS